MSLLALSRERAALERSPPPHVSLLSGDYADLYRWRVLIARPTETNDKEERSKGKSDIIIGGGDDPSSCGGGATELAPAGMPYDAFVIHYPREYPLLPPRVRAEDPLRCRHPSVDAATGQVTLLPLLLRGGDGDGGGDGSGGRSWCPQRDNATTLLAALVAAYRKQ